MHSISRVVYGVLLLLTCGAMAWAEPAPTPPVAEPPAPVPTEASKADEENYVLGYLDVFSVTVMRRPEFSGEFTVPRDGRVNFPAVGEVSVSGLTLKQLQETLTERLTARLKKPEVYVTIRNQRPRLIYVTGFVNSPAPYNLEPGWRVAEAITAAGGLKIRPERARAFLFRPGAPERRLDLSAILQEGSPDENVTLQPGDMLSIQELKSIRVFVSGLVETPGDYDLDAGLGVVQAVTRAGGIQEKAALSKAVIYRDDKVIPVNLYEAMVKGNSAHNLSMQQNDVLIVPPNMTKVGVMGEVKQPAWYPMDEDGEMRLSDALSLAGGVTNRGITTYIWLVRTEGEKVTRIRVDFQAFLKKSDLNGNPLLKDNDVIVVPETKRISLGEILQGVTTLRFLGFGF